ncbi:LMBR1-like membrane protein [Actinidia rufa]|uniref:LMBR1-like membrane protein n=1 Tax=Actinidia rufa TaxID=165716 RepID=A0A7J0F6J9_9ERIC|nr:LMBR1-like membrane protein [Actinidia rufa]
MGALLSFGVGHIGIHFCLLEYRIVCTYAMDAYLSRAVVPLIQGFEDAGDFTVTERLKTSIHVNLVFYLIVGSVGLFGLILLIVMSKKWSDVLGLAMAGSNTFGLVTGAFLLGFGLSEVPKSIWRNADWITRQKVLSHKISKMAVKLDDAHQELSNAIVVAQATSKQMSKRDPLRPYMDVIDVMLVEMFREDPSFEPQGGRLGENDMDYDTDEKSMATLRRHLRKAKEEYYRYKSEYMTYVMEALELEDTVKNYERRSAIGWKFVSSLKPERTGKSGPLFDTTEFIWRCILRNQLEKLMAVILGCMSAAILLAEATLLPSAVDLSLFSVFIKSAGKQEVLVQKVKYNYATILLMQPYSVIAKCICFCSPDVYVCLHVLFIVQSWHDDVLLANTKTNQLSQLAYDMLVSMVARYAPPISYNFLNLIRIDGKKTIFEERMGNIDDAVPLFGTGFNKIYPLIMVMYTLLVVSNFFDRVINFFGNWKIFRFQTDAEDTDGFDPSGLIILQKERTWIEQGRAVGELVIPLARDFSSTDIDVESGTNSMDRNVVEMKATTGLIKEHVMGGSSKPLKDHRYGGSREAISNKYAVVREQSRQASKNNIASAKVSLLEAGDSWSGNTTGVPPSSGLASTWASVKSGFQSFKAKKFLPLGQFQDNRFFSRVSSSESLDDIFQRLKRPGLERGNNSDED